jgi:hypothetical protein
MIAPFAESGFRVSEYRDSCCLVSWLFNPPKPEMSKHRNLWPHPPPQLYRVSRLREFWSKESRPLVFETAEMSNPDAFSKGWLPNETFRRFRVSDFATSRIRIQVSRFSNLRYPKQSMEIDSAWRRVHATCLPHCTLFPTWILATCPLKLSGFGT